MVLAEPVCHCPLGTAPHCQGCPQHPLGVAVPPTAVSHLQCQWGARPEVLKNMFGSILYTITQILSCLCT